jgi:putative pyruvate formate lyase activating enzyme
VVVRHLLMPGHFDCCTEPVLAWLAARPDLRVSLLTQYVPPAHARGPLARPLDPGDAARAAALAGSLGLRLVD